MALLTEAWAELQEREEKLHGVSQLLRGRLRVSKQWRGVDPWRGPLCPGPRPGSADLMWMTACCCCFLFTQLSGTMESDREGHRVERASDLLTLQCTDQVNTVPVRMSLLTDGRNLPIVLRK